MLIPSRRTDRPPGGSRRRKSLQAQFQQHWKCTVVVVAVILLGVKLGGAWWYRTTPAQLALGKELFEHQWSANDPLAGGGDGLGPVFNARSCAECHHQGGAGGGGSAKFNVTAFSVLPTADRPELRNGVIHTFALFESQKESEKHVQRMFPIIPKGQTIRGVCLEQKIDFNPLHVEQINTPALWGLGRIDEISGWSIQKVAAQRRMSNSLQELSAHFHNIPTGRVRYLPGRQVGKFGWKGQFATLEEFVAAACAGELGLTNPHKSQHTPLKHEENSNASLDMSRRQFNAMASFVANLPEPRFEAPAGMEAAAAHGRQVFESVGCATCHTPDVDGLVGVYSDFCLYDLEDNPSEGNYGLFPDQPLPNSEPRLEEWKTPPLWGVADSAPYLHDGSAQTLEQAISMHNGAARTVSDRHRHLPVSDQKALIAFLRSLRAPLVPNSLTQVNRPMSGMSKR